VLHLDGWLGPILAAMEPGTLLVRLQLRANQTLYGQLGELPLLLADCGGSRQLATYNMGENIRCLFKALTVIRRSGPGLFSSIWWMWCRTASMA